MEINAREVARLIELNKKKAELEFKSKVMGIDNSAELKAIVNNANDIAQRVRAAGIVLVFPNQTSLDELGEELDSIPPDNIREGLKVRDGKAYNLLQERGIIVKRNYENRFEIAKICLLVSRLSLAEKKVIDSLIREAKLPEHPVTVLTIGEKERMRLSKFLTRCGIACTVNGDGQLLAPENETDREIKIELANRIVWISEGNKGKIEDNLKRIKDINTIIQLKNAERQIKVFSEEEETQFELMQKDYLELLKEQDKMLEDFYEEEKFTIKS